jgi:diaminopimelate epimerase
MELYNADGSRAEISGNGLRCFALALADAGVVQGPEVLIATDAGIRRALLERCDGPGRAEVSLTRCTMFSSLVLCSRGVLHGQLT